MYTQCPSCATVFEITLEQLQKAEGEARCGLCNEVFSAVDSLVHELPPPDPTRAAEAWRPAQAHTEPAPAPPPPEPRRERPARAAVDWMERVLGLEGEADAGGRRYSFRQLAYAFAVAALLVLAVLQYGHFNSAELAGSPSLRPYVASLCAATGCPVPPRRAPERIAIAGRTVRSHPRMEGALLVEATLVNRAEFEQPLPQVQLKLRALNGRITGARWFAPQDYLAPGQDGLAEDEATLPPGGRAALRLEVMEPPGNTQGFEFAFR